MKNKLSLKSLELQSFVTLVDGSLLKAGEDDGVSKRMMSGDSDPCCGPISCYDLPPVNPA